MCMVTFRELCCDYDAASTHFVAEPNHVAEGGIHSLRMRLKKDQM